MKMERERRVSIQNIKAIQNIQDAANRDRGRDSKRKRKMAAQ